MRYVGQNMLPGEALPTELRETIEHLEGFASISRYTVVGASWPDAPADQGYGVVVELPGGALVGYEFRNDEDAIEFEGAPSDIANSIARSCEAMLPSAMPLAQLAETIRRAASSVIEAFPDGARLVDLAQIVFGADYDAGVTNRDFALRVDCLGPHLQPHRETLFVSDEAQTVAALLDTLNEQAKRRTERGRLESLGADGCIDLLTLRALGTGDDLKDSLRQALRHERFWTADELCVYWRGGSVQSATNKAISKLEWTGDRVLIAGLVAPETRLSAGIGQPVTDLVMHNFLSPSMIVLEVENSEYDVDVPEPFLTLRLDVPTLLFDAATGRVWPDEQSAA